MKNTISRIMGVVLSLTMLLGSLVPATPVAAAPGDTQWFRESLPGTTNFKSGASPSDIAVADATTVYVIDNTGVATARVYKSTDAGQSFTALTTYPGGAPMAIDVAPDDVNAIAVTDGVNIYISNDAGTTWSTLVVPGTPALIVMDIAVAPKRSGTLLGREYAIAIADPAAGINGDVRLIGATAAFTSVAGMAGTGDFTSVMVTPNYVGDRCLLAVGTGAAPGSTSLLVLNSANNAIVQTTVLLAGGPTVNFQAPPALDSIRLSSIAVPSNFDPTTASGRRAYVTFASVGAVGNDVYRVDDNSSRALGAGTALPFASVAYDGTVDTGTLFAGRAGNTDVKFSTSMTSNSPTWTTTSKAPNGITAATTRTKVATAKDFGTSKRVFAATTSGAAGENNGFFISNDASVSFDGECFLNGPAIAGPPAQTNTVVAVQGLELTADGKTLFMATDDTTGLSLWKCATPVTGSKWSRILYMPNPVGPPAVDSIGMLRVNPGYATAPAVYLIDVGAPSQNIYVSQNGGATFATRMVPAAVTPGAFALQDANTIYLVDGAANAYKSTNGGWTWTTAVASKQSGATKSMIVPKADWVVIGGTSGASYSKDGGASYSSIGTGLSGVGNVFIAADEKFDTIGNIYAAAGTSVYRYVLDVSGATKSAQWDLISLAAGSAYVGAAFKNGALYAMSAGAVPAIAASVDRTLNPQDVAGTLEWFTMDRGNPPTPVLAGNGFVMMTAAGTSSDTTVYGFGFTTTAGPPATITLVLAAYKDWLAVTKPELTQPANNATVAIDPVIGRSETQDLKWKAMGTSTGTVNTVDVDIAPKSVGFITGLPSDAGVGVNPAAPFFRTAGYLPNTEYIWRVRASNTVSLDAIPGLWSEVRTFMVQSGGRVEQPYAGPVLLGPTGGAMNVNPTLVGFSWAPVSGATEYTVIVATDSGLTKTVASTPAKVTAPAYQATGLEYGTTYFWSVQATKPTVGPQAIGTFSTMAKPVPPVTTVPPTQAPPTIVLPTPETPAYIWAVIVIGAILVIAVIILIVNTRKTS